VSADSSLLRVESLPRRGAAGAAPAAARTWTWDDLAAHVLRRALRPRAARRAPRPPAGTFSLDAWPDSEGDEDLKQLAGVYHEDAFDAATLGEPKCDVCGAAAEKRCSKCRNAW
jgi:hypothetical protein